MFHDFGREADGPSGSVVCAQKRRFHSKNICGPGGTPWPQCSVLLQVPERSVGTQQTAATSRNMLRQTEAWAGWSPVLPQIDCQIAPPDDTLAVGLRVPGSVGDFPQRIAGRIGPGDAGSAQVVERHCSLQPGGDHVVAQR